MTRGQQAWILLFVLGLMIAIIGFQGNLGTTIAILFAPAHVTLDE